MYTEQDVVDVVKKSLDPTNRYHASQRLGREATIVEAVEHYLRYGPPLIHIQVFDVESVSPGDDNDQLFV